MKLDVAEKKAWAASHAFREPMVVFFDPKLGDYFYYSLSTWTNRQDQSLVFQTQVEWAPL